jgi:hypothetical protein
MTHIGNPACVGFFSHGDKRRFLFFKTAILLQANL